MNTENLRTSLPLNLHFFDEAAATAQPENTTGTEPGADDKPQQPASIVNVDIAAIIAQAETKAQEAAEKKTEAVFKSMLQQQGLDAATIAKMTDEWKAKQQTPEQVTQELREQLKAEQDKNEAMNQRMIAIGKGISSELAEKYIALAKTYPEAEKDIGKAIDAALVHFPLKPAATVEPSLVPPNASTAPAATGGTGTLPEKDEFSARISKYKPRRS